MRYNDSSVAILKKMISTQDHEFLVYHNAFHLQSMLYCHVGVQSLTFSGLVVIFYERIANFVFIVSVVAGVTMVLYFMT